MGHERLLPAPNVVGAEDDEVDCLMATITGHVLVILAAHFFLLPGRSTANFRSGSERSVEERRRGGTRLATNAPPLVPTTLPLAPLPAGGELHQS